MNTFAKLLSLVVGIALLIIALQWISQDEDAENVIKEGANEAADLLREGAREIKNAVQ